MSELNDLKCGLTGDHIVKEPISLVCGHCICKKCVIDVQEAKLKCTICSEETDQSNLQINKESTLVKNIIKRCLSGLFDDLEKRATEGINSFKSLLENRGDTIDAHITFIEEEIEIRNTIKINLDQLFEKLKKDLIIIKKDLIEIQNDALNGKIDTKELEKNLNELRDYIKENESKTEERFYEHQENFKNINKTIKAFQEAFYSCKLDWRASKDFVDEKLIGEVLYEGSKRYKMKQTLLNAKFELIEVDGQPTSLISLPNGNLVCGTTDSVKLLDENLKEIKSVTTGGWGFCAFNRRNEIYVTVDYKNCIILFDLNLNQLKQFGSNGVGNNQLNCPFGLCCRGDYLYICDCNNKRIQILSLDFEYVNTIQLDGLYPYIVHTSETTIGVSCRDGPTFFFDLKTRALKLKHDNYGTWNLNYIDSTFYGSNYSTKKFYLFDSYENFIEEMVMNESLSKHIRNWPGGLCRHKDVLYLADFNEGKILKFIQ